MNMRLTCWPLNAIGVDLNSQNQQKGAGVHRVAVLVHFKCAGEIISFTPSGPGAQEVEPSPSTPPNLTEWSFRDTEGDRAEPVLQTDVRVNSSGKRFLSQAHFPSQPPLLPPPETEESKSRAPPSGPVHQRHYLFSVCA